MIQGMGIRKLRTKIGTSLEAGRFHINPPDRRLMIDDALPFDEDACQRFLSITEKCESYLEFGSGASTLYVARARKPYVSVESDRLFLDAVRERIAGLERETSPSANTTLLYADIGPTGPWGKPILPSFARPTKWSNYPHHPWRVLGNDYFADTILVDGRFRVACALAVIFYQKDRPWTMLIDDYDERPHYREIERFANLLSMHGRMAEFKPMGGLKREEVSDALQRFVGDWR